MQQAAQMQDQVQRMQDEAAQETAQSSVGGGLVKVTANGAGDVVAIEISPDAIDPDDPEALADLVLAGVNEALRSARVSVEAKAQQMLGDMGLGGLGETIGADVREVEGKAIHPVEQQKPVGLVRRLYLFFRRKRGN